MPNCEYLEPQSIEEVCSLLARHGNEARLVAGGQTVALGLKNGWLRPSILIGLRALEGLGTIERNNGRGLRIGSLATHRELASSDLVREIAPALFDAEAQGGDPQIRCTGTLGGALAQAHPAGDPAVALIALGATVVLRSARGERSVACEELFVDAFRTVIEADELLTHIEIPPSGAGTGSAHCRLAMRMGDYPVVSAAACVSLDSAGICTGARIVIGNCEAVPKRAVEAEQNLVGSALSEDAIADAARRAREAVNPRSEAMASGEYKKHLVGILVRDALRLAMERIMA